MKFMEKVIWEKLGIGPKKIGYVSLKGKKTFELSDFILYIINFKNFILKYLKN